MSLIILVNLNSIYDSCAKKLMKKPQDVTNTVAPFSFGVIIIRSNKKRTKNVHETLFIVRLGMGLSHLYHDISIIFI